MKIGPFGIFEIAIILIVILIIFGPKNLPKLGTAIGKAVKNLREGLGGNKKVKEAEEVPVKEAKDSSTPEEIEVEVIDKPEPTSAKPAPKAMEETNNA